MLPSLPSKALTAKSTHPKRILSEFFANCTNIYFIRLKYPEINLSIDTSTLPTSES